MILFELMLGIIFLIGCTLKIFKIVGGNILIVFSLLVLTLFYFIFTFYLLNKIKIRHIFKSDSYKGISFYKVLFSILCGWAISTFITGVLFELMHYYGGRIIILSGSFELLLCIIILVIKFRKARKYTLTVFKRIIIIISIGLLSMLLILS